MAKRGAHILPLPYQRIEEQAKWWILESITTDYGKARYYLFAKARVYQTYYVNILRTNSFRWEYRPTQSFYLSPNGWDSLTINPKMYGDKRLDIFFKNRQFWFSARAGHPSIVEKFNDTKSVLAVAGVHFYYNPKAKTTNRLPSSVAVDCNLSQWGFENT